MAAHQPALEAWLVEQIYLQYGISKGIIPALLSAGQICLLLDGLDEVAEAVQEACVETINQFRENQHVPLAVCSRTDDYDLLSVKLKLRTAVAIQPLSEAQIAAYLTDRRHQLHADEAVRQDDALKELARTPLFLSVMAVAYQGYDLTELRPLLQDVNIRQQHLYQAYLQRAFGRLRQSSSDYPPAQSLDQLAYLARQLGQRRRYDFFFEELQPDWLPPAVARRHRRLSALSLGLGVALVGGLLGALVGGLLGGLLGGLVGGLVGGLLGGLGVGLVGGLGLGLVFALGVGLGLGLVVALVVGAGADRRNKTC